MRRKAMNVYSAFAPMFHVSRALGVLPLVSRKSHHGVTTTYRASRLAQACSFSLIGTLAVVVVCSWEGSSRLFNELVQDGKDSHKRLLVNKVEYVFSAISSVGNLFFSMTCGKRLADIFQTIDKVDATLRFPTVVPRDMRARQRLVRLLTTIQTVAFLCLWALAFAVDLLSFGKGDPRYWCMTPFYFLRLVTFCLEQQFIQVALIFRERFVVINDTLEGASSAPCFPWTVSSATTAAGAKGSGFPANGGGVRRDRSRVWPLGAVLGKEDRRTCSVEQIEKLRVAHETLCLEVKKVNKAYELPLLADILMMFFDFIAGGYFFITDLLDEGEFTSWGSSCSWVMNSWFRIAFLSWVAWSTSGKARKAGPLIVRLMRRELEAEAKEELNIFLMQLSQQETRFNIMGLFYLEMTVLQALTQAATSYLLVLVQFQSQ